MKWLWSIFVGLFLAGVIAWAQTQQSASPGVSGPGTPFSVTGPIYTQQAQADAAGIKQGFIPNIHPLLDLRLRHTSIILAPDHNYYMTGTGGENVMDHNDGIELWRSSDLSKWDYLGLIWSIEKDGTWQTEWRSRRNVPTRTIWAPRLQYIRGNYYIAYGMFPGDRGLLKSASGKPEGPYVNAIAGDGKLSGELYASLFEDDDGKAYMIFGGGWVVRMKDDLSGVAEDPHRPTLIDPDVDPAHHDPACAIRRHCEDIGHENSFMFKKDGKYYLSVADTYDGRYSNMVAISDNIYGPYHTRHEAVPSGGGGTYFQDKLGQWWCTFWGNDPQAPWLEMPGIIRISFNPDGTIHPAK